MSMVHDNEIFRYEVNIEKETITLYTKWEMVDRDVEYTTILFNHVLAHYFIDTNFIQNVIFDIEEMTAELFWKLNRPFVEARWGYGGFNFIKKDPAKNPDEAKQDFLKHIESNELQCYDISSSYGLSGWVIAKDCQISTNSKRVSH